ncbi:MAG: M16 family metallopeptidase [Gemmatimonadales bacterium]
MTLKCLTLATLGLLALTARPLSAQGGRGGGGAGGRIAYDTFSLANGLRVVYSEDHSTPIVSVDVWYHVGSRDERPGRSGFAHLFEHMMFQGSAHVGKTEHMKLVERAGGDVNGSTAEDRTNYYQTVPSNRLNLALWLEADRMRSLAITQENFENQRETVKEERRLRIDNQPYSVAFIDGLTWAFDSTACFAYAHTVIGSMDDLNAAKLPDVQAFFDTYYVPNNAVLVVVGDFVPTDLRRLVGQYFGAIPRRDAPPSVACQYRLSPGPTTRELQDRLATLPAALRFYRVPPHNHADTHALELLNVILGQGESSRLNVGVVRRAQAAVGTQLAMNPFGSRRGPGAVVVLGVANQGVDVLRMDSLIAAQVDSVRRHGITPEELEKAKNVLRGGLTNNRETTISKAEELHHYFMFHDGLGEINTDLDRFLAVTAEDVRRVAATYLAPENALRVIVRPGGGQ